MGGSPVWRAGPWGAWPLSSGLERRRVCRGFPKPASARAEVLIHVPEAPSDAAADARLQETGGPPADTDLHTHTHTEVSLCNLTV